MKQVLGGVVVLLLACLAVQADDKPGDKLTPRAEYDALVKEHQAAQNAYFKAMREGKTPQEKEKNRKEAEAKLEKVQARFVALAEKHPGDPVAVDALVRVVENNFTSGSDARKRALEVLARDHAKSDKVGPLCRSLAFGFDKRNERLLRAILDKNPSKAIQAEACLALTQTLERQAMIVRRLAEDEALRERAEQFMGKEAVAELRKADPAKLEGESEKLSRQLADRYVGELKPDRLVALCQRLRFSSGKGSEVLLRSLLKHEKREVQGVACLTLAQVLKQRADAAAQKDDKQAAKLRDECEKLFARAADRYADVKMGFAGTVGDAAKKELYEIRYLAVGKPAPEVEGQDQDGKKFKLSDYKGKVVLLDFWNQF